MATGPSKSFNLASIGKYIATTVGSGVLNFLTRPTFNGNAAWDIGNLPAPITTDTTANVIAGHKALHVGMVDLGTQTVTNVTEIDFASVFTSEFDSYEVVLTGLAGVGTTGANNYVNAAIQYTADNGATYVAGNNYQQQRVGSLVTATSATAGGEVANAGIFVNLNIGPNPATGDPYTTCGSLHLYNNASKTQYWTALLFGVVNGPAFNISYAGGIVLDGTVKTGFRLMMQAQTNGTGMSGTVTVYGRRKSV